MLHHDDTYGTICLVVYGYLSKHINGVVPKCTSHMCPAACNAKWAKSCMHLHDHALYTEYNSATAMISTAHIHDASCCGSAWSCNVAELVQHTSLFDWAVSFYVLATASKSDLVNSKSSVYRVLVKSHFGAVCWCSCLPVLVLYGLVSWILTHSLGYNCGRCHGSKMWISSPTPLFYP